MGLDVNVWYYESEVTRIRPFLSDFVGRTLSVLKLYLERIVCLLAEQPSHGHEKVCIYYFDPY